MIDLREINRLQFATAKRYWAFATDLKLVVFGVGAYSIFLGTPTESLPQWLLLFAVLSEMLQIRSDAEKGRAEGLLRTLDLCQSFGREVSEADKRDIVYGASRATRHRVEQAAGNAKSYFDTTEEPGPKQAVQNLIESAWYTKHLARAMSIVYGTLIAGLVTVSIAALLVATRNPSSDARDQIARMVTSWLLLIVSLDMLKNVWSYYQMDQRCQKTEAACDYLLRGSPSEADALKQWYEYQVARAASPLLPNWLFRARESSLDDAWRIARSE